ncbi:hypothetical protein [Bradyrhizobium sp. AZCC 2289]|uniref:hypothetical protein n=1 Tax=Bradyrhizobium sp. AZCC 2289 TaxID=3117026 RepID=UPI002FF390AB
MEQFTDGPQPFHLDTTVQRAVRAATFIAGVNRARIAMSDLAAVRLRKMILDNLKPDRDMRQIEHEFRGYIHLRQKFGDVRFADLEGVGKFDLLCVSGDTEVEVECKTLSEDTGNPIKNELVVNLSQTFLNLVHKRLPVDESGIFSLQFKDDPGASKAILQEFKTELSSQFAGHADCADATIDFLPRPSWTQAADTMTSSALQDLLLDDPDVGASHCFTKVSGKIVALALKTSKENTLAQRVVRVLKDAADQLSGARHSLVWLHFVGFAEQELRTLAEFSMNGAGGGLNALVAGAISPSASPKDRSHVNRVRFTGEPAGLERRSTTTETSLIQITSLGGFAYDVPNPLAKRTLPLAVEF